MATYLVTGGCGFIGSHLADALVARGDRVRILDDLSTGHRENAPKAAEIVVDDVADAAVVRAAMAGMDGCFHLAAIASVERGNQDWAGTHRVNLGGAIHVLDAARKGPSGVPVPVVYASSAAVFGDNPEMPLTESSSVRPISAYGADKLGCEQHARVAWLVHKVPAVGLRFFNVYGPRQDPRSPYSGVISIFADRVIRDQELTIFGDGGQTRDFIYVGDVVRTLLAAMAKAGQHPAQVYNVCTGKQTSVRELAELVFDLRGKKPRIKFAEVRLGDIRVSVGDGARAAAELGIRAQTALRDGLKVTLDSLAPAG
ncbi:MAG: NAD-dependent epimerase/dehydratase family protein [Alphaproteobacteria bacterium]